MQNKWWSEMIVIVYVTNKNIITNNRIEIELLIYIYAAQSRLPIQAKADDEFSINTIISYNRNYHHYTKIQLQ